MTTPEYELILMLDPEAPDERREQIVADARSRIEGAGTLKHDSAWGMRNLAYEIRQRTEADYRFFRFQCEPPLLESLDHELKIADGVLRFRIFKVDPQAPMIVPPAPVPGGAARPRRTGEAPAAAEPPAPATAEAPAPAAEAPAPPAADGSEAPAAEEAPPPAAEPAPEAPAESGEGEADAEPPAEAGTDEQ